jgi:hypothetical protein
VAISVTWAVGAAGAIAAAAAWVVNALLAVVTLNACAVGAALDSAVVADACATGATTSRTPTEVGVVATLTVADCVDLDSLLAGVDVGCCVSGAAVAGGVLGSVGAGVTPESVGSLDCDCVSTPLVLVGGWTLAVSGAGDTTGSVPLVTAPPLLLTVTPDATWVVDDVAPDVVAVPAFAVASVAVDVDPVLVDVEATPVAVVDEVVVPVVDVAVDPADDSPDDVVLVELVEDDSEDVPVVSAAANP